MYVQHSVPFVFFYVGKIQTSADQKDAVEVELQSLQQSVEEKEDQIKQQEEKVTQIK